VRVRIPAETQVTLRDGREARIRPIRPDDVEALIAFHDRLSLNTVRLRFSSPVAALDELPPSLATVLRPGCTCGTQARRSPDGAGA
jgi:hypothetical protein